MVDGYQLTRDSVDEIRHRLFEVEREVKAVVSQVRSVRPRAIVLDDCYIGLTDGSGISARVGTTLGSGNVTLYATNPRSGALVALSRTEVWYNISQTAVGSATYVIGTRDKYGTAICIVEDCG